MRQVLIFILFIGQIDLMGQDAAIKTIKIRKDTSEPGKGWKFYKSQCQVCLENVKRAPKLNGVTKKYSRPWLLDFIKNAERLCTLKDPATLKIMSEWNKEPHVVFESFLTERDVETSYEFIKKYKP